jgi:hypothetical protein
MRGQRAWAAIEGVIWFDPLRRCGLIADQARLFSALPCSGSASALGPRISRQRLVREAASQAQAAPPSALGETDNRRVALNDKQIAARIGAAARLGGARDRVADIADQSVDQRLVVRFAHHPDDRLGARRADQKPAM